MSYSFKENYSRLRVNAKNAVKFLLPRKLIRVFLHVRGVRSQMRVLKEDISNLIEKYDLRLSRESIIVGNGPSLESALTKSLGFFNDKTIFCVNNFVSSEYFEILKPLFYVFADPSLIWEKDCSPSVLKYRNNMYKELKTKVKWKMFLVLPAIARKWNCYLNLHNENENIILIYYNNRPTNEINVVKKYMLYKKNVAMIHSQTVLVSAMFLSLNLGFRVSYIMGGDLSMHQDIFVNQNNEVCTYNKHFYDKKDSKGVQYWKNEYRNDPWKMNELFFAYSLMFKGFLELEEYSKFLKSRIYNVSANSFIDAFERYDLADLIY